MEYIEKVLNLKVIRKQWKEINKIPYFLTDEYEFEQVLLNSRECLFVKPKEKLAVINTVKKHLNAISRVCNMPVVFEFDKITRQKRKSFIENRIPFVVTDKQLYLPFMGVALQEEFDSETVTPMFKSLLPSAQMLLFAFIYGGCKPMYLSDAAKRFNITAMSISRAANQLIEFKLLSAETQGRSKILYSDIPAKDLFDKAKPYLVNPVRKVTYIDNGQISDTMFLAGLSAVAELSMLNSPQTVVYGTVESVKNFEKFASLEDIEKQCVLEFWKYDATLLSGNKCADVLSLAVYFDKTSDERTEKEIEKLLEKVWQ